MRITIPENIHRLCDTINSCGYDTYIIGSSLRALMSGRRVGKWDIITSATPKELHKIFNKSDIFSILEMTETEKYGVSIIRSEGNNIELSTMREDGKYNRYSKDALYTRDIMQDLSHRDFTINAIAYDMSSGKIIDFKHGRADLTKGILRCVDDSEKCLIDDPVRILRAYRFKHAYHLHMDKSLSEAIIKYNDLAKEIPSDRFFEEFNKIILTKKPGSLLHDIGAHGLFDKVFPEYNKMVGFDQNTRYQIYDLEEHVLKTVDGVSPRLDIRLAALLHDIGKPIVGFTGMNGEKNYIAHAAAGAAFAENILRRLGYNNKTVTNVCNLIKFHDNLPENKGQMEHMVSTYGSDFVRDLIELRRVDIHASSRYSEEVHISEVTKARELLEKVADERKLFSVRDLPIDGNDIKRYMGIEHPDSTQGMFIGKTLRRCANEALLHPEYNNREFMEAFAKSIVSNKKIPDFIEYEPVSEVDNHTVIRLYDI